MSLRISRSFENDEITEIIVKRNGKNRARYRSDFANVLLISVSAAFHVRDPTADCLHFMDSYAERGFTYINKPVILSHGSPIRVSRSRETFEFIDHGRRRMGEKRIREFHRILHRILHKSHGSAAPVSVPGLSQKRNLD